MMNINLRSCTLFTICVAILILAIAAGVGFLMMIAEGYSFP